MPDKNKSISIELKRLAGLTTLNTDQIKNILENSIYWIENFYNLSAGTKKVSGNFNVEGFAGKEFDLSTSQDILNELIDGTAQEPYLFLSDLLNFVEQIRTSLNINKIPLNSTQNHELDKLGNIFNLINVNPQNNKISVEDLEKIENIQYAKLIVDRIKVIYLILEPSIVPPSENEVTKKDEEAPAEEKSILQKTLEQAGKGTDKEVDTEGQDQEITQEKTQQQPQPIKISELDPQTKLYLQSLSIITINQALGKYFNEASLQKLGLPAGTQVTFDQLPLQMRKQLMDRSFLQVENLLLSGEFSVRDIIDSTSSRINFGDKAALGLLMDAHGLNLLNGAVQQIAGTMRTQAQTQERLAANQKQKLSDEDIPQRIKDQTENILDGKQAEQVLTNLKSDPNFAKNIESELNVINSEEYLDKLLMQKIGEITGGTDQSRLQLVADNIRPFIEVFVQQGLPPEYVIADPKQFDYNRFKNIFGNSLDQKDFNAHKEEIANLITFYWKRKRALWSKEIRQEFAQEKYTQEEVKQLFDKVADDPKQLEALRSLGLLNYTYGGHEVAEQLAGISNPNKELSGFLEQQRALIAKYLEAELASLSAAEQQEKFKVYFEFYAPGVQFQQYSLELFQQQIVPQINPMDFYMLQANEAMGAGALAANGAGFLQRAFTDPNYQGTQLLDGARAGGGIGEQLANKALKQGLYTALDAAGGWGEALKAAEKIIPGLEAAENAFLNKILAFIKKNWPLLLLASLIPLLLAFAPWLLIAIPAYLLLKNTWGSLKNFFAGGTKPAGIGQGAGTKQLGVGGKTGLAGQTTAQTGPLGQTVLSHLSPAMVTASQAVIATFSVTAILATAYHANLNLAFLTDFPMGDSSASSVEKTSKYAQIDKSAKIVGGCSNLENNGTKCENPSFPVTIEYTVTIQPKEDFAIQITDMEDITKFKQSKQGWEDAGKSPPTIETQRTLNFDDFKAIIKEQVGLTSGSLEQTTEVATDSSETTVENIIIEPGDSLTFTYTLDDLSENYNHTAIINTLEVNFYYQNDYLAGNDNMITAARVCLGDCSAGAGCWPTTGQLSQLPFSEGTPDTEATHRPSSYTKTTGYADAYDIADRSSNLFPNVYVPYPGKLCFKGCSDTGYGCYYILTFDDAGTTRKLLFAHFEAPNSQLSTAEACMEVEEGFLIAPMGNKGNSTGTHLHYGLNGANGNFYTGSRPTFSVLETLVPETDNGSYPANLGNGVTTCYE